MEWRDSRRLTMKIRKEIHEKEIQTMKLIKTKKRKKKNTQNKVTIQMIKIFLEENLKDNIKSWLFKRYVK